MKKETALVMHAVDAVIEMCGNSYINAYTEQWLRQAKDIGAYYGTTVGKKEEVREAWQLWVESSGGLPDLDEFE